jgi:signal transduction histidine kinase
MAYGSAKHLLSLINDLLDISKIETGELKPDIEEFNIAEVGIEIRDSLKIMAEEKGLELIFNISDINIFSDKRRVEQILLPFVQLEYTITEEAGTGLGLYLTKNLVQLLKGRIQMESEYEKGCTFTFILPIEYGG